MIVIVTVVLLLSSVVSWQLLVRRCLIVVRKSDLLRPGCSLCTIG